MTERAAGMEKTNSELQDRVFPSGRVTCMGERCMRTSFGCRSVSMFKSSPGTVDYFIGNVPAKWRTSDEKTI